MPCNAAIKVIILNLRDSYVRGRGMLNVRDKLLKLHILRKMYIIYISILLLFH